MLCKIVNEKWVKGYCGLYSVTRDGVLYSYRKEKTQLKTTTPRYETAVVSVNGRARCITVHRAVAQAFIPNLENKPCVNHKDGVATNNHFTNLEWVTYTENNKHAASLRDKPGHKPLKRQSKAFKLCDDLPFEVWKPAHATNGVFSVSNFGRVKRSATNTLIVGSKHKGYMRVSCTLYGKRRPYPVHRLVASEFLCTPPSLRHQVNHKDYDKNNNAAENLEWVLPAEHARHTVKTPHKKQKVKAPRARRVVAVCVKTNKKTVYANTTEAAASIGHRQSTGVFNSIKREQPLRGFLFSYENGAKVKPKPPMSCQGGAMRKKVLQRLPDGSVVEHNSIDAAARHIQTNRTTLTYNLRTHWAEFRGVVMRLKD